MMKQHKRTKAGTGCGKAVRKCRFRRAEHITGRTETGTGGTQTISVFVWFHMMGVESGEIDFVTPTATYSTTKWVP
jgi:hypothetical protein